MVKHSKKLILGICRREMEKRVNNYRMKVTDLSVPQNELKEIEKSEDLMMRKLSGKIYDNIITKIDNKTDKKERNYEDIKITRFLQWKFWRYYVHAIIFWLYVEQTLDVKKCIYNTIHCKYGEYYYQTLKQASDISSFYYGYW